MDDVEKLDDAALSSALSSGTISKAGPALGVTFCTIFSRAIFFAFRAFSFSDVILYDCEALPASVPIPVNKESPLDAGGIADELLPSSNTNNFERFVLLTAPPLLGRSCSAA